MDGWACGRYLSPSLFDDFASVHDINPIGVAGYYTQVVSDDKNGDPYSLLRLFISSNIWA